MWLCLRIHRSSSWWEVAHDWYCYRDQCAGDVSISPPLSWENSSCPMIPLGLLHQTATMNIEKMTTPQDMSTTKIPLLVSVYWSIKQCPQLPMMNIEPQKIWSFHWSGFNFSIVNGFELENRKGNSEKEIGSSRIKVARVWHTLKSLSTPVKTGRWTFYFNIKPLAQPIFFENRYSEPVIF